MDKFPRDLRLDDGGADDGMVWAGLGVGGWAGSWGLWLEEERSAMFRVEQTPLDQLSLKAGLLLGIGSGHRGPILIHMGSTTQLQALEGFHKTASGHRLKARIGLKSSWLLAT